MIEIFTIGHSTHSLDELLELLMRYEIEEVVDIRSHPGSRHHPHFNRPVLQKAVETAGMEYRWAGEYLGGRPRGQKETEGWSEGDVEHALRKDRFRQGLERLVELATLKRTAILCAEEDPSHCHRSFLVARGLGEWPNVTVLHIRGDGRVEKQREPEQLDLF